MPSAREVILELIDRVAALEQNVADHDKHIHKQSEWDQEWGDPRSADPHQDASATLFPSPPEGYRPDSHQPAIQVNETSIEVAAPSEDQLKRRRRLLPKLGLENLPPVHGLDAERAEDAYLKGGPYWLYCFDRSYVMSLGVEVRRTMVADIQEADPQVAQLVGRDILKDESPGDPELAVDKSEQWREHHGTGFGA